MLDRLSELEGMRVFDREGRHCGRVLEARSPGAAESEPTHETRDIASVLVGREGWLDRLGWSKPDVDALPLEAFDLREDGLHLVLAPSPRTRA